MNFKFTLTFMGIAAGSAFALSASPARAASFGFSAQDAVDGQCVGQMSCSLADEFFTLSTNKTITQKTVGGVLGLGVAEDAENLRTDTSEGEIDADEWFDIGFGQAAVLEELQLSHMYQPGEHADFVYEMAEVEIWLEDGSTQVGTLQVTGDTSAVWSGSGSVDNLSASFDGINFYDGQGSLLNDRDGEAEAYPGGGSYSITNPFGDLEIAGLRLRPRQVNRINLDGTESDRTPGGYFNSDFTVSSVVATTNTADVPEPAATAALIGFGAMALGLRRRQK